MKEVTVNYFQQLHALTVTIPTQYATMCESSRLYEPGSQFMEYIKRFVYNFFSTMNCDQLFVDVTYCGKFREIELFLLYFTSFKKKINREIQE